MTEHAVADIPSLLVSRHGRIGRSMPDDNLFRPGSLDHDAYAAILRREGHLDDVASLYVHLPFCPVRCLDCESNSVITHNRRQIDEYLDALERELHLLGAALGQTIRLQQLHLGGGSPNYLDERQLVRLMAMIDDTFERDETTDCSLDANVRHSSPSQFVMLNSLGFSRIFFGIRDVNPSVQFAIGRNASVDMIRDVFDTARDCGFATVGTDILYGLPCQTSSGIESTIEVLRKLSPDRISCNAFSRHASERAHQNAIDNCRVPSLADKLAQFNTIVRGLSDDYEWIGLDNFSRHDDELATAQANRTLKRDWLGYSHLPECRQFGIGTNAITDVNAGCMQNLVEIDKWKEALHHNRMPISGAVLLDGRQRQQQAAIKQLMCNGELQDFSDLFDDPDNLDDAWAGLTRTGLLELRDATVRLTDQGRYLLPHLLLGGSGRAALQMQ